ncbi:MAG TPA: FliA/WhiG family RNA polymerase sigma factor [Firmicutes bacterium]|nr:FliA/WhiG family RNA polymerase sigma factor [Bacillota bacterium]
MTQETGVQNAARSAKIDRLWRDFLERNDPAAREALAIHYLYLVSYIYGRIAINLPPHIDREDLEHQGALGLLAALDNFNPDKQVKFETYASIRIRGAIIDYLRKQDLLSRPLRKRAAEIERAAEEIAKRSGKVPSVADIAQHMGTSIEEISDSLWKSSHSFIISLEREVYEDEEGSSSTVGDSLSLRVPDPHDEAEKRDLLECMSKAIEQLPEKERQIIALYYLEELTLKEIGAALGISESRVCQIHSRAVFNLRRKMQLEI